MKKILLLLTFLISICLSGYSQCTPSVSITADRTAICTGSPIIFTATPTNEGTAPLYEWFINNVSQGAPNSLSVFTTNSLTTSFNSVYVQLTSNAICASPVQATSNIIQTAISPIITAGVIGSDQTICSGTSPSEITEIITPTGVSAAATYNWESSPNNVWQWSIIPGATASTYTPTAPIGDMYYRRIISDASFVSPQCNTARSNSIHIQVTPTVVSTVSINDPGQVCSGVPLTFTATPANGGANPSYQWYMGTTPVGTNDATYTNISDAADNGKQLTVKLTSSLPCPSGPATSSPVMLSIVPSVTPTVSVVASAGAICAGMPIKFTATSTGAGTTPAYQWYVNLTPAGTGGTSFTATALNNADQVWVNMTSSIPCVSAGNPTAVSNKISVDVKPIPNPRIVETDQTICAGESIVLHADNISAASSIVQWQFNATNIPNATNWIYTAMEAGSYSVTEDNGVCNATSAITTITIDACSDFSSSINGPATAAPGQQNVVYSVTNQTGFTYVWNVTGGTIASGQNTNAITVNWDGGNSSAVARTAATEQKVSVTETKESTNVSKTTSLTVNNTSTAITTSLAQSGIQFYPNPSADAFNIVMPQSGTVVQYNITDLSGMSVASGTFTSSGGAEKITTNFNTGLYQVVLKYNETVTCIRLNKVQ